MDERQRARQARWGENLRGAREANQLTQAELGERIGASQASVARWESGAGAPTDSNKIDVARVLGVDVYALFPLENGES